MGNQTLNIQPKTPAIPVSPIKPIDLGQDKLLEALFFFWDGFERATMNFFLTKDTARDVIADRVMIGDKLTLGIRKNEWEGGQDRVFRAFIEHEKIPFTQDGDVITYKFKDVPVQLRVYDDNPCIQTLNIVFYGNETFNVPTPFDIFCEKYDK